MFTIADYGTMIADTVRVGAYERALREAITPRSVVVDIGTGTGIFALIACQLGALRVYAIEPNDAIEGAREVAAISGFDDRIVFFQDYSTQVTVPEPADVIVSELRGVLPLFRRHIPIIVDARTRFLKTGGRLIPERDTLWAAVVEAPALYSRLVDPWERHNRGLDMEICRRMVLNNFYKGRGVEPDQLLSEPRCWGTLDYPTIESPQLSASPTWEVSRPGVAHGFVGWFDSTLAPGVHFSNAPGEPETICGSLFFPFMSPVEVAEGDRVSIAVRADLVREHYVWSWETVVGDESGHRKAEFHQSTFYGAPLSQVRLRQRAADDFVPLLNGEGEVDRMILEMMDGRTPLREIAERLSAEFPSQFARWEEVLPRVAWLSLKYTDESGRGGD